MAEVTDSTRSFDPNIQSEDIAFSNAEMIACNGCGRLNPPNRFNCIYCAHALELSPSRAASARVTGRKLEAWERGFNVILLEQSGDGQSITQAADLLGFDIETLSQIAASETPLPVARVESKAEAETILTHLMGLGLACSIVSDDDLAIEKPHIRLAGLEFTHADLVLINFNTGERTVIAWNDLRLIVCGILTKDRVDSLEKKRRGGKTKLIDQTATSSDEQIFDLYRRNDATGFRVYQAGFDFSCIGENMGLLATENMRMLIADLRQRAPEAMCVNSYGQVRHLLNDIWEIESRKDFHGLQRSGFGKVESASVASTSNLTQFNKFSRMQAHLR